uniref:ENTH domain containing 1 n=1 Tax=Sus scrofa TaxID=9823 RepID=F1SRA0_PIG
MAFRRQVKNFVKNYSDAEIKVREATSNDPWGPSSSLMLDISDLTFNTISLSEIMNMLWQRLSDHGKNWRHVYKSLTLMDYLIKNGSKKVIQHCREGFPNLQSLKDFQHIDEAGKDQGYYIREKSKQVITLLMDEQLLHREREVACRTRRRTSYSMTLPKRLPGTGNSPTACASALHQKFLHQRRKTHCFSIIIHLLEQIEAVRLIFFRFHVFSRKDLMLFCEDDPKPVLPTIPAITSSTAWLSEGQTDGCNLWDADVVPVPSEKSPSLQTNVSLDKKSDSTITNAVIENPLQTPLEKQSAAKSFETLTALPASRSLSKEDFISSHLRISKSDSTFYNQGSTAVSKDPRRPAQSSVAQLDDENLKTLTTLGESTNKRAQGTASFSTLSVSSPDSASPEKSVHPLPPVSVRSSFWTLFHQQSSSASVKEKTARVQHPFAPRGPLSSDEEETDNIDLLEILPDNSDSAKKQTSLLSRSNWVEFSTQNVDPFTSLSCSSFQATQDLPREPEANNSTNVLLGEVKNAIVKLHEDLSMVIRELNVINSRLVSMSGTSPQVSKSLQLPQDSEGGSEQV